MRRLALFSAALALVVPLALQAFDNARWLARREAMTRDAARLRAAYSNAADRVSTPSEGITIPLETNPDGSIRTSLYAAKAQFFLDSSLVWADDLVMTKLDDEGAEKLRIEASRCVIDRDTRSGWIEGHARIVQGKTVFEGDGVYFSSTNSYVTSYSNSRITSKDLKFGGLK